MSTSRDPTPTEAVADEVEGASPVACWSVRECDWRDQLPEEMAALLAPPVIVSAEAFVPAGQPLVVGDNGVPVAQLPSTTDAGVPAAYHPRHAAPEDTAPRLTTPSLPRRLRRRRRAA